MSILFCAYDVHMIICTYFNILKISNQPNGVTHYVLYRAKAAAEKKAAEDKAAEE